MSFLQIAVLWGLPLVLLPLIIHLVNRLRHRNVEWAAMIFLHRAKHSSTRLARLKQWLIMLMRMAAILMLLLALARPIAGGWLGGSFSTRPDNIVILLDRSASMGTNVGDSGCNRLQASLKMVKDAASKVDSRFTVIDSVRKEPVQLVSLAMLDDERFFEVTDTATDMPRMLEFAFNYITSNRHGHTEVWLVSDMQNSNWRSRDKRWAGLMDKFKALPQSVTFRVLSENRSVDENVAVTVRDAGIFTVDGENRLDLVIELKTSAVGQKVPLKITVGDDLHNVELVPNAEHSIFHQVFSINGNESVTGSIELPADGNPCDNYAFFSGYKQEDRPVVVVSSDERRAKMLGLCAMPSGLDSKILAVQGPEQELKLNNVSLVVWDEAVPNAQQQKALNDYVVSGGVLLIFPSLQNDDGSWFELFTYKAVEVTEKKFSVSYWLQDYGVLGKTASGFSLPLGDLQVNRRKVLSGDGDVIASYDDGNGFIIGSNFGKGKVFFMTTRPFSDWSGLGRNGLVMVPVMQRMKRLGEVRFQNVSHEYSGLVLGLNEQERSSEAVSGLIAGIYNGVSGTVIVNRPELEDAGDYLEPEQVEELFSDNSVTMSAQSESPDDPLQRELWKWFAILALTALVIEGIFTKVDKIGSIGEATL